MFNTTLFISCLEAKGHHVQCTPDISWSCISRNRIYCGRMLDPIFLPLISLISLTWRPKRDFSWNSGNFNGPRSWETVFCEICSPRLPLIQLAGDNFPQNLLWANLAYLWNAGGNTCCAMASHGRRIINTSIVSQSRVLSIRCPCKSVPPTANQGKTNAFLIKSSLTTCWYLPFCEDGQVRSKSSANAWLVDIPLVAMHTKIRIISWRKTI